MSRKGGKQLNNEDRYLDTLLRPVFFNDYIGQAKIKKSLKIILGAAQKRNEASDHLLFYGQPGLGKTTLALLIAKEMRANIRIISGPNLSRAGDLAAILFNLENNNILFIDEAHRVSPVVEELLYSALDNRKINLTVGKGPSARLISLDLPPFTLISATTRLNLISNPLRSRFGAIFHLDYYQDEEISEIIKRSSKILQVKINEEAISMIAKASRFTPRLANRLLKRCRDVLEINNSKQIDEAIVSETFEMLDVDALGLENFDRQLLSIMIKKFNGGPVGVNNLATALGEEKGVIEEVCEPYLIKIGFLQRTPKGRIVTKEAHKHLNRS